MAKKQFSSILIIILLSLIFGLYFFELFSVLKTKIQNKKNYSEYYKKSGNNYDERYFTEVFDELNKNNNRLGTAAVTPSSYINEKKLTIFPLSGISNALTLNCNENGYYSKFISDNFGFNNVNKDWNGKEKDFVLIGDSFVLGNCVNKPEDITSILKDKNFSAINLGYAGNGPLLKYATLKEYFPKNTKNVLWFFYEGNDLQDLNNEKKNKILCKYLKDKNFSQSLKSRQIEIDKINIIKINARMKRARASFIEQEKITYKMKEFIKLRNTRKVISNFKPLDNSNFDYDLFLKIIIKSKNLTEKNGAKFHFIYLPEIRRYNSNYKNDIYYKIINLLKANNISFIDIKDKVFDREPDPLILFPFRNKGHYNNLGYKKVGNVIINNLTND